MDCIDNLKEKFYACDEAMKQCLPIVDPKLVHELLQILKTEQVPMYTIEVYLNTDKILKKYVKR